MKRDELLWHRGVGGIRDFGSLIKIHVFFCKRHFLEYLWAVDGISYKRSI